MSHVEIHGGIVLAGTITDANGTRSSLQHVGSWRFFVDVVEAHGGHIGMWDGDSYEDAIREADVLSKDFGPVSDLVIPHRISAPAR